MKKSLFMMLFLLCSVFCEAGTMDNYVVTPTPNSTFTVEELKTITITFPDVETVGYGEELDAKVMARFNGSISGYSSISDVGTINGNMLTITVPNYWFDRPNGTFEISFYSGAFVANNGGKSNEIKITWTVQEKKDPEPEPLTYEYSPAAGSTVTADELENFVITFHGAKKIEVDNWYSMRLMYRGSTTTSSGGWSPRDRGCVIEGDKVKVPVWVGDPNGGEFTLNIHEGLFIVDGQECPEINIDYTIKPIDTNYDLKCETTTDSDGRLHAVIPEGYEVILAMGNVIELYSEEGHEVGYVDVRNQNNDAYFTFYTYEGSDQVEVQPGKYYFTCPAATVTLRHKGIMYDNREVKIYFEKPTMSGIRNVNADSDASKDVFGLDGRRVKLGNSGVFIVKGKKYIQK